MTDRYELVYEGKANGVIPVLKYKSKDSGLTVAICQVEGPLVNGYFCLATEAHDDDGLPHTLEHLVFMGSENYPYKGVLDLLANRCLASGTNAWTDTDHTCYTMTTAGSEGFLKLMPIYLDHVLYPTITEAAYITEVQHINGEGEDAGVVYCEMQARENTGESRTHLALLRAMYPGHCGYKSETGGMLENLRTSTSHTKVVNYHKEFYRPENLGLIITGQVEPAKVFEALSGFEEKIKAKGERPTYTRPWQNVVPPLPAAVHQLVQFPSDDEETGMVYVGWRGPMAKDQYAMTSIMILMEYLTETAVAPLQRDFVEIDDPMCGRVHYSLIENSETCVYIKFMSVPKARLNDIKPKLVDVLNKIGKQEEKIDNERMQAVIHRRILEALNNLEDHPHDSLSFMVIGDLLYGSTKEDLDTRLNQVATFKKLKSESVSYWVELLNKFFIGTKDVTIIGEPSTALMEKMGEEEKERTKKQAEMLGPDGLKEKGAIVEKAVEANEEEPPEEMLTAVDVPSVDCIQFHHIRPASNADPATADIIQDFPLSSLPVLFQLDDMQTNFANVKVIMNTSGVPENLKLYLPIFLNLLLESPVLRDGTLVSHEEIIKQLASDTLAAATSIGVHGGKFRSGIYSQMAMLLLKVEQEKYEKGVQWVRDLLFHTQMTTDRVKIIANKMINEITNHKRKGNFMVDVVAKEIMYGKESNHRILCVIRQQKFLSSLVQKIENDDSKQIISDLNELRSVVTNPANLRIHLGTNIASLSKTVSPLLPWQKDLLPKDIDTSGERPEVHSDREFLYDMGSGPADGVIVGIGSVESNFLIQTARLPLPYDHPDLPAIHVFLQYLTQLEGPMWRQIRGLGLSYHYSMVANADTGMIKFLLYKSAQLLSAYKQAMDIVNGYVSGSTEFSEVELDTCKSSLIFEIIEEEETPDKVSLQSLLGYFRGTGLGYNKRLIKAIPHVTMEDLLRVGKKYIAPVFDPKCSKVAICCHPTKVEEITKDFKEMSRELKVVDNVDESFLAEF